MPHNPTPSPLHFAHIRVRKVVIVIDLSGVQYNYLCTYDFYSPVHNVLDPLLGQVGGGWALEFESFLGPVKWHRVDRRVPFGAQKHM